jgi:hypothetical protein
VISRSVNAAAVQFRYPFSQMRICGEADAAVFSLKLPKPAVKSNKNMGEIQSCMKPLQTSIKNLVSKQKILKMLRLMTIQITCNSLRQIYPEAEFMNVEVSGHNLDSSQT